MCILTISLFSWFYYEILENKLLTFFIPHQMLNRMFLSIKNQWFDEKIVLIFSFSIEDIMELLNCGRNKMVKSLQEF